MSDPLWLLEDVELATPRPRLRGVSCAIGRGVTLVLGPSGAGKTSLLDLLVGFAAPTRGRVQFRGASCAWAPADFALWPHLEVRAHLEQVHPGPSPQLAAATLLQAFALQDVAACRPAALSSGQQSRLATARALATSAAAVVLDEPFAHLDDAQAAACAAVLLAAVRERDVALVVATHAPRWLETAAPQRLQLREGRLVAATRAVQFALLCLGALLLAACSAAAAPARLRATGRTFAVPPAGSRAPAPRAVSPAPGGEWLVLDNAGRVLVYAADGQLRRQWEMPEHAVGNPEGICALADGSIAVADTHYHRLVWFTSDGRVLRLLGGFGDGPLQFRYPVSVAQDVQGALYVAEYGGNDRVQKLTASGEFVLAFGSFGSGAAQLQRPAGVACVGTRVYVADAMNGRVQVFDTAGGHVTSIPAQSSLACPYDVAALAGGDLLVAEHGGGRVLRLSPQGAVLASFGSPGRGAEQLATPWAVAAQGGRALIADTGNRRLLEIEL
jgi:ABC-type lipoprotein export system ATPase subunit/sugar lactone lactonase YvrE